MKFTSILAYFSLIFAAITAAPMPVVANDDPLVIYIDADYTIQPKTALTIELGLRSALAGTWAEEVVTIIPQDHRNNARRSVDNLRQAWRDPNAVAVFGGKQSPPYIIHGEEINAAQMPLLLPWSAGGVLTRMAHGDQNWIFRLSVDDYKAATAMTNAAISEGCTSASLVVVDNPWGLGNASRMRQEFLAHNLPKPTVFTLPINAGNEAVSEAVRDIQKSGSDCVIMVTVFDLGTTLLNALGQLSDPPKTISHWGILGSRLTKYVQSDTVERLNLRILGTCGLQRASLDTALQERVDALSRQILGMAFKPEEHPAPHGFFHAYDLGKLLLAAIEMARETEAWNNGTTARRHAIRDALQDLDGNVKGLLKVYDRPFYPTSEDDPDGHEALGADDLCMTTVNAAGNLVAAR